MTEERNHNTVRVHYCFKQHLGEKLPENCLCRKEISYSEAEHLVTEGRAAWVILSRTRINVDEIHSFPPERGRVYPPLESLDREDFLKSCPICSRASRSKKLCTNCGNRGYIEPEFYWEELSRWQLPEPGGQIVMTAQADEKGRFNLALHKKTPRVATVEWQHIIRAYLDSRWEAQQRIEEYGLVNLLELYGQPQGASLKDKEIKFTVEPEDVPGDRYHDAQGREYDWGRSVLKFNSGPGEHRSLEVGKPLDERTQTVGTRDISLKETGVYLP